MAAEGLSDFAIKNLLTNMELYGEVALRIRDKDARLLPLKLNFAQKFVHEKLRQQYRDQGRVRAIILKARQTGFSTYTAGRFFRRATLLPRQRALIVAHEQKPAEDIFGIYDRYFTYLPEELKPMVRSTDAARQIRFDNPDRRDRGVRPGLDSIIEVGTANNANLGRGITPQMVHASELAMWEKPEDTWLSLMQGVPKNNSEVIIESTAKGHGNFFHNMWLDASTGESDFIAIFLPWWIHDEYELKLNHAEKAELKLLLDDQEREYVEKGIEFEGRIHKLSLGRIAWRRWAIRNNCFGDERLFRQEYPANPEEAFLVSGNTFIEEEVLKDYKDLAIDPKIRGQLVRLSGGILPKKHERGYLRIWEKPNSNGLYVIGADTAEGRQVATKDASASDPNSERGGRDFSSADVFDVVTRRQVAQLHGRMAPEIFADQLNLLGRYYSTENRSGTRTPALIAVEKNHNSGESVLRLLQKDWAYPNLFRHRLINRRRNRPEQRMGFVTSVETRMPMLDGLAQAMREGTITIPSKDTIRELMSFVRDEEGKPAAQEGAHDDRVISLAIAHEVGRYAHIPTGGNSRTYRYDHWDDDEETAEIRALARR